MSEMTLEQAQQIILEAVENPDAAFTAAQLARACAVVLVRNELLTPRP